ncbi:MAG: hypothetical protein LKI94_13295 [Sporolactobacillus sp.]|nr:hypothetical protein [Sporolactobacillus sp.]MCI1883155.1 hypothetical protein [Sporolactobacillus sp.]
MNGDMAKENPLNRLRRNRPDRLTETWEEKLAADRDAAYRLINDPSLCFPALFLLHERLNMRADDLELRPKIALAQIQNVLHGAGLTIDTQATFADQHDRIVDSLLWILHTGWDTLLSADYAQVIDQTAIQILHTYHCDWIKGMTALIFYRYKNKSQRHYLIGALFETADPRVLVHVANHLLAGDSVESDYARRLLSFIPEVRHAGDQRSAFAAFESWFEENGRYLIYTGETNDTLPAATPFRIHCEAKYFGKIVDAKSGRPIQAFLEQEKQRRGAFDRLPPRLQSKLAELSARQRNRQPQEWRRWLDLPIEQQLAPISPANSGGERR